MSLSPQFYCRGAGAAGCVEHPGHKLKALIDAVAERLRAHGHVRTVLIQFQRSVAWLDRLQAAGVDFNVVKLQSEVHNKSVVATGAWSHSESRNWSDDGAVRNRDASVIIETNR